MVFTWHFVHFANFNDFPNGNPVPFNGAPSVFPLALFDEGHTGVALFMVLSGYLFAKLLDGRSIRYPAFFWNRFLRLAPLLVLVFLLAGLQNLYRGEPLYPYLQSIVAGFFLPTWPNGGWSIAIEMHFYLALPFLLYLTRRWKYAPLAAIMAALAIRTIIFLVFGEIQYVAYWTIIGRADDFLLGIAAFKFRDFFIGKHWLAIFTFVGFTAFFWVFDYFGGFYQFGSRSPIWIILPTFEAAAYSILVAYYDSNFRPTPQGASWALSKIGDYSYSIYLLHPFFVFKAANLIHNRIMDISNFYVACLWALVAFAFMIPIGFVSFNFFEKPFLRLRKPYIVTAGPVDGLTAVATIAVGKKKGSA